MILDLSLALQNPFCHLLLGRNVVWRDLAFYFSRAKWSADDIERKNVVVLPSFEPSVHCTQYLNLAGDPQEALSPWCQHKQSWFPLMCDFLRALQRVLEASLGLRKAGWGILVTWLWRSHVGQHSPWIPVRCPGMVSICLHGTCVQYIYPSAPVCTLLYLWDRLFHSLLAW